MFSSRDQFANQFEPQASGYLYRKGMRGAPVRVTAAERDTFVESFDRGLRILDRSLAAALIVLIVALATYATGAETELPDWWLYVGMALIVIGYMIGWLRLWNAPAAQLQRRAPVGGERSRAEMNRIMLANLGWGQMTGLALVIVLVLLANWPDDWQSIGFGDGLILLAWAGGLLAWCVLAIRKLRAGE